MLFRIISHPKKNPEMRDKLICIYNLPEEFYLEDREGHKVLKSPWEHDNPLNLSRDIRAEFDEKIDIFEAVQSLNEAQVREEFRHKVKYLPMSVGVIRIDYSTGPGEEAWRKIETYMKKACAANVQVEEAGIVGDQLNWTMEAEDVPVMNLPEKDEAKEAEATGVISTAPATVKFETVETAEPENVVVQKYPKERNGHPVCDICGATYKNKNSLRSHKWTSHSKNKAAA